ncbi:cell division FtsA domain-containing protein [Clostridium sp. CMCC3677]|uniref:cell division FtsA domain-containing protein n=1 Tax=Clostridium sp. CMCC3677 TaxID=2949963 RepID=UPI0013F0F67C|nr:cell division FtsA domain-containing protein [Clostridium sp. CMCC3677]NFG62587.1 cell division protein FtsA [Clostridium botulinum]NFQ10051.1 cell division protein FtsA [Clostridium botulinum]
MQEEIIASIDFGSKKLSASLAAKKDEEDMQILGVKYCKSKGIEKGIIKDVDKCREVLKTLLKDLEDKSGRKIKNISAGISTRNIRITEVTVSISLIEGIAKKEDINEALKKARNATSISDNEILIDTLINFYILDGKVLHRDILNWRGNKLDINLTLIIGLKDEITKYYEIFKGTNYNLSNIKLNILCGKQIFLTEDDVGDKVLVDIGAGNIDMAIFSNGIPKYIGSIPLGGSNISKDLAICGELSFSEAENIKIIYSSNYETLYKDNKIADEIEVGTLKISKSLFYEVINARIEEILNYINRELKNTGHYDRICSIILYGSGLNYFENISNFVNDILKISATVITKDDLGIKNPENITSLAVVKEVYDNLDLISYEYKNSQKVNDIVISKNEEEKIENKASKSVLKKVRDFLEGIF